MAVLVFRVLPGMLFLMYVGLLAFQGARWVRREAVERRLGWRDGLASGLFALGHVPAALYFGSRLMDPFYVHVPAVLRLGGLALFFLGMVALFAAHFALGKNWSPLLELREGHTLVTFGAYRCVRHPMYVALGVMGFGMLVLSANWVVGAAFLVPLGFLLITRLPAEEELLRDRFGEAFVAYAAGTERLLPRGVRRVWEKRWARATAVVAAVLALSGCVAIVRAGVSDELQKADVAVVLGCRVYNNGVPGRSLKSRLDAAVERYRQGWFPDVFVSGGMGRNGYDEATVMRQYLVAHGIPAEHIHADSAGVNTQATALHAAAFLRERGLDRAMVISQFYHVPRAQMALRRAGVASVYGAHARYFSWLDVYAVPRELVAIVWYRLRG